MKLIDKYRAQTPTKKNLIDLSLILIIGLVVAAIVKIFFFQGFYIPSESMNPTLKTNDRVVVNVLYPNTIPLQHGDIIVFQDKENWMAGHAIPQQSFLERLIGYVPFRDGDANFLVKRVIGLPGDTVSHTPGETFIRINGEPSTEPYLAEGMNASNIDFNVTVPANSVWVMGDNRSNSSDSRYHQDQNGGFISYNNIVGKVVLLYYPLPSFKTF